MRRTLVWLAASLLGSGVTVAHAACHLFMIDQVYSNGDGTVQYVVMRETTGSNGENFWAGSSLQTTGAAGAKQFPFPSDLPSSATASRSVLIGTTGFAALGVVAPDYTMPNGFIPTGGGTLRYTCRPDQIPLPALPTDGATAIDREGAHVAATPKNFAGATATLNLMAAGAPDLNQHGLTGSWYEPATSGQGIEVEFFPSLAAPGTAFVQGAWFTFDVAPAGGADRQRWYTFSGNAGSGQPNVPITIYQNVGGNFNAPPVTSATPVGSGTLAFSSCTAGTLAYTFSDGSGRAGAIPLTRLTPNVTCAVGSAGPTNADFAFSGNWYAPVTSGQGFLFELNPLAQLFFFAWYTYAPTGQAAGAAGQRWFTGQVNYAPGTRTIAATLYETTGGIFDQSTNPLPSSTPVGTATVTLESCASTQLHFNFTAGSNAGKIGDLTLIRVGPVPAGCVAAASDPMMPPPGMCSGYGDCPP